jgi:hypothetical protein
MDQSLELAMQQGCFTIKRLRLNFCRGNSELTRKWTSPNMEAAHNSSEELKPVSWDSGPCKSLAHRSLECRKYSMGKG